ncbi:hypothetical protein [Fibrisoma limi]|nr:hypothetical protein [Fibrisoma limi]
MLLFTCTRKALLLLAALCLITTLGLGQKVDLDRFYFEVSYLSLPREFVEPDQRSYGVRVETAATVASAYPEAEIYEKIRLFGYQKTESNPTVGVQVRFENVRFEKTDMRTRTVENKDKEGKVTSRTTYYTLTATYSAGGVYRIYGPRTDAPAKKRTEEPDKDAKPNRFLQAVTVSAQQAPANQSLTSSGLFPSQITYTTKEFTSGIDASRYFEQNQASIKTELINKYVNDAIQAVNGSLNGWYGYVPVQNREHLWILDSKKHPEFDVQQEAIKAVKDLMKTMSATQSVATLTQNLQPVIEYFQTLKTKYAGDDKQERKMRYSAYYNLAKLYYFLDQPDKAIEEANGLVKNDYDTSDGKKYAELAEDLKKELAKHRLESRHMDL